MSTGTCEGKVALVSGGCSPKLEEEKVADNDVDLRELRDRLAPLEVRDVRPLRGGASSLTYFGLYGTVKAALDRRTVSLAAGLYADGIAVNAAAPSKPVATPGAGTLNLAKTDTEDIGLIAETAFMLCTGDPATLAGQIARTQPFLGALGRLR